jgi:hypothetical protein
MTLRDLFLQKTDAIVTRWLDKTLATYPPDTIKFFKGVKDQFANPVGQTLAKETEAVFCELRDDMDADKLCTHLDGIIKIQAIQELTPAQAVAFVFLLKDVIQEECKNELQETRLQAEWMQFMTRIDQLALFAFDIFTRRREKVYELRVNEVKRSVSGLMRRLNWDISDPEPDRETPQ